MYACLLKSRWWKAYENAYFRFKHSSCLWSEHWKCADKNLYIYKTGGIIIIIIIIIIITTTTTITIITVIRIICFYK